MAVQEPVWLRRSRPCPFFSQGRCLFADSCNFLHDVKVKRAVNQPLLSTVHVEQPLLSPEPVFDPPSVLVYSASPVNFPASTQSTQDSSRYSGLLSVLSDVIGPVGDVEPPSRITFATPPDLPSRADSLNPEPDSVATLADPSGEQMEFIAEFLPILDDLKSADGEATAAYLVDMDDCREEVIPSNRQSILSSFTGASLLASPRHCVFEESSLTSPIQDNAVDLLSPVQLSTKLRPFSVPLSSLKVQRGDSIDSGYADGDNWVGPVPFPPSPPRSFSSPVTFLSYSQRAPLSSPQMKVSHRLSSRNPIEVIEEHSDEDDENTAYIILGAYSVSSSEEHAEDVVSDPLQVYVTQEKVEEEAPAAVPPPRLCSAEHLYSTKECGADSCSQPLVSDDNLSFKTALSTQPSYEDLSDVSRVSPIKHDSLLSSFSGCSTPDTSVFSHDDDANGSLEQSIVGLHVCESSRFIMESQINSAGTPGAIASGECSLPEEVSIDLDVLFLSPPNAGTLQGLTPEEVLVQRAPLFGSVHFERRSQISSPSVHMCYDLSSAKDVLSYVPAGGSDLQQSAAEKGVTSSGAFHFETRPSKFSPLAELPYSLPSAKDAFDSPLSGASYGSEHVTASRAHLPCILHCDRRTPKSSPSTESSYSASSCKDNLSFAPSHTGDVPGCALRNHTLKSGSFTEDAHKLSSVKDVVDYIPHDRPLVNDVAPGEHYPSDSLLDGCLSRLSLPTETLYSPSSLEDVINDNSPGASVAQGSDNQHLAAPLELPCVLHSDRPSVISSPFVESSHHGLRYAPPAKDENSRSSEQSPTVGHPAECIAAEAHQDLNSLGPDEGHELFDSVRDNFNLCQSFPLLPVETVGHLILSSEEDMSVLTGASLEENVPNSYALSQDGEVHLNSDLTEKVQPSKLPLVGPPYSDTDSALRRRRAASDLTVKRKSPQTTPGNILRSPPRSPEQSGQSDSVQSLYDEYFDDGTSDDGSMFFDHVHENTAPPIAYGSTQQEVRPHLTPHAFHGPSPTPNGEHGIPATDFPRSETILRPLLTGRRSFLHSSLSGLTPKGGFPEDKKSSPTHPSTRLQAREIGSTMVPLGFRRHKPQPAATQSLRRASQPLCTVLPASELREVLRIRTDIARDGSPLGCSSARHISFTSRSLLPVKAMSAPPSGGLKQLGLSSIVNQRSFALSTHSSSIASSILSLDHISTPQSPSVSSTTSFSHNSLPSSSCEQIPKQFHHTPKRSSSSTLIQANDAYPASQSFLTRRNSRSVSAPIQQPKPWRLSHYRAGSRKYTSVDSIHRFSKRTSTLSLSCIVAEEQEVDEDATQSERADGWTSVHAIATPKPTLLFAIASDNVDQVRQVLESGEAGPNDSVGPQSALAFTLTNDKLAHKQEIVKALLAYGADPSVLRNPTLNPAPRPEAGGESNHRPPETTLEKMDPATRYFVARADTAHTRQTSQLIYRSIFRPLTRVRYDVIGQDWALEQLFRVLSMHSQKLAVTPIVVLLCGPSGHGKSLLARKFGYLLDVPTHTVNMTTLRSAHDIWQSYSMSPYEEPSSCTLAEFLIGNEGKRCVVVLDEIEKVEDEKALWSLLMPWELGRCSLEAGKRHVDARNVIWLGTSNAGHELVFEHHENRTEKDQRMSREEYLELTGMLRPCVSHCLGASLISRVTTVLPFVPFTLDEKKAIAAEAVYALAGDASKTLSPQDVEVLVTKVLPNYHPSEGARSLHRAISDILMDTVCS